MKHIIIIALVFFNLQLFSQGVFVEASINKNCISKPGNLRIERNHKAAQFKIEKIEAGHNCYNGKAIQEKGFTIKDGSGLVVYTYKSSTEVQNPLDELTLGSGIYKVYVEGGRGASVKINYVLQSKDP
jgi:hypothetical protein